MRLFIAEKKGLGEVIAQALGNGVAKNGFIVCGSDVVTWGSGHLLELVPPEAHNPDYKEWHESHLPLKLRPHRYQPIERTAAQFRTVAALVDKATTIVHAGDPDAEGQLLIDEILTYTRCNKPVKRVLINDLNTEKARQAISQLKNNSEFYGLSQSALARSIADQLYGFNMTRGYTLAARKRGFKGVLSVGRVQTVILGLIVRRYEAFKNHEKSFYYLLNGQFDFNGGIVLARFQPPDTAPVDDKGRISDKDFAYSVNDRLKSGTSVVTLSRKETKTTPPPLPFSLLDLQVKMSSDYGIEGERTLSITQALRDKHKAITYNRSDCRYLNSEQFADAPETVSAVITALSHLLPTTVNSLVDFSQKGRAFNDSKVTAHTAIIPTTNKPDVSAMSKDELAVYQEISKRYLLQFMPLKEWILLTTEIKVDEYRFVATARKTTCSGWSVFESIEDESTDEIDDNNTSESLYAVLSGLKESDSGHCACVTVTDKETAPLPIYTEATLLKDLTRVAKYVTDPRIKSLLLSRDKGNEAENGGIGTPATRTKMIETLQNRGFYTIEKGKLIPSELGISFIKVLPSIATTPDMTALWHEQQQQIERGELTCDAFLDELEIFIAEQLKRVDLNNLSAPVQSSSQSNDIRFERIDAPCPSCGKHIIVTPKFFACTGCGFRMQAVIAGKKITSKQVETLIKKGKTTELKGFVSSKTGNAFSASLVLADKKTGSVSFEFSKK
ncbi:DNA topoisomerase-3 [Pantoea ananatis]|uniref:type IA DNA topoisomerase n=1 Tax=Pantoea ananas TaxID=553 RepID=UPI00277D6D4E|nr:type IA DNA topoisomerase [Pantoea ananatis]MDQ1228431.1 DNA topoisomerase-3 [Pantoea ananatis]